MADNDADGRLALRFPLERDGHFEVIAETCDPDECMRLAYDLQPDVVVVNQDRSLGRAGLVPLLRLGVPKASVIAVSERSSGAARVEALQAGADAYLPAGELERLPEVILACFGIETAGNRSVSRPAG